MTIYSESKILPVLSKELFDIVIDIEKYPEFLPWCIDAEIIKEDKEKNEMIAILVIKFKGIIHKYTSKVTVNYEELSIIAIAIDGPFKKLVNEWYFKDIDDCSSEVKFFIDFEFNSFILNKMLNLSFNKTSRKMVNAFCNRIPNKN